MSGLKSRKESEQRKQSAGSTRHAWSKVESRDLNAESGQGGQRWELDWKKHVYSRAEFPLDSLWHDSAVVR